MAKEITGPQTTASGIVNIAQYRGSFFLVDPDTTSATYATYRLIRKQPTISLLRTIITAAIVSAGWTFEENDDAPEGALKFIHEQLTPVRPLLVERAIKGGIDFGWSPFEKVYDQIGDRIVIAKMKPLLQDITDILVDDAGNFVGFSQSTPLGGEVTVPFESALLFPFNVEGTNWYGEPLLENTRSIYTKWNTADDQVETYDDKVVGTRTVVYYPPGTTKIDDVETDNAAIAQSIIDELETDGDVAVPATAAKHVDELNMIATGWRIEELQGKGMAPLALERLKYLDVLMCRAMGMPERTVIEGAAEGQKVGTETAQRFALQNLEMLGAYIAAIANVSIVDQLLGWNFGMETIGSVRAVASPIEDEIFQTLSEIAKDLISTKPEIVDADSVLDHLKIPKAAEVVEPVTSEGEE